VANRRGTLGRIDVKATAVGPSAESGETVAALRHVAAEGAVEQLDHVAKKGSRLGPATRQGSALPALGPVADEADTLEDSSSVGTIGVGAAAKGRATPCAAVASTREVVGKADLSQGRASAVGVERAAVGV
jgi:hypothetical protein